MANLLKLVPSQCEIISKFFFKNRPDLLEQFFEDYTVAQDMKLAYVPINTFISRAYKMNRRIFLIQGDFLVIPDGSNWISLIGIVNKKIINRTQGKLLPLNFKIIFHFRIFNLIYLLNSFFSSFLNSIKSLETENEFVSSVWWIVKAVSHDNRPIIIPSLNLPPKVMEGIGYILAIAINVNIKVPFIIHWDYFNFSVDSASKSVRKLYPNFERDFIINAQISRLLKLDERTSLNDLISFAIPDTLWLVRENDCAVVQYNSEIDLLRLILSSSSLLRNSLIEAMKFDSISLDIIYKLLFK